MNQIKASVFNKELGQRFMLILRDDSTEDQACWRWYEEETDADTEVSGLLPGQAIERAIVAWDGWDFQLEE